MALLSCPHDLSVVARHAGSLWIRIRARTFAYIKREAKTPIHRSFYGHSELRRVRHPWRPPFEPYSARSTYHDQLLKPLNGFKPAQRHRPRFGRSALKPTMPERVGTDRPLNRCVAFFSPPQSGGPNCQSVDMIVPATRDDNQSNVPALH